VKNVGRKTDVSRQIRFETTVGFSSQALFKQPFTALASISVGVEHRRTFDLHVSSYGAIKQLETPSGEISSALAATIHGNNHCVVRKIEEKAVKQPSYPIVFPQNYLFCGGLFQQMEGDGNE